MKVGRAIPLGVCRSSASNVPLSQDPPLSFLILPWLYSSALGSEATPDSEIVVEAPARSTGAGRATGTVTVVAIDEKLPATADLPSVVDAAAGTTVRHLGGLGDWSAVSIRGSTLRQVVVCLDGIPLNPDGSASVNLAELPLRAFSRVEVWRGNAPPELGVGPIGGVVNLITADRPTTSLAASMGSFSTSAVRLGGGVRGRIGPLKSDMSGYAQVFGTRGNFRYFSNNGTDYTPTDDAYFVRGNNQKAQTDGHFRWRIGNERARVTVLDSFVSRGEGLPGSATRPASRARLDTRRNLAAIQAEGEGGDVAWRLRGWNQSRSETLDDRVGEIGIDSEWRRQYFSAWGAFGDFRYTGSDQFSPAINASARRDTLATRDLTSNQRDGRLRQSFSLTASAPVFFGDGRVRIAPVAEFVVLDDRQIGQAPLAGLGDSEGRQTSWWSPRLGVAADPVDGVSIRANAGLYRRPADLFELFGQQGVMRGNPGLVPERGIQGDVGLHWVVPGRGAVRAVVDGAVFAGRSEQRIVFVQNAQQIMFPMNIGRSTIHGAEASLAVDIGEWLHSASTATVTGSQNLSSNNAYQGNQLPRVPALDVQQTTSLAWRQRLFVGHSLSYTAANYWDQTNWFRAASRPIHAVFFRFRPLLSGPEVELDALNIANHISEWVPRNPLDSVDLTRMQVPVTDFSGYPLPGLTIITTVRWHL